MVGEVMGGGEGYIFIYSIYSIVLYWTHSSVTVWKITSILNREHTHLHSWRGIVFIHSFIHSLLLSSFFLPSYYCHPYYFFSSILFLSSILRFLFLYLYLFMVYVYCYFLPNLKLTFSCCFPDSQPKRIEYILEWNLLEKKCKTAILLYCFHTAGVLHIFMVYNLLGPGISFYRKSKIIVKRKPNYEIGWFHNWPMIISHRLYAFKRWYSVIAL